MSTNLANAGAKSTIVFLPLLLALVNVQSCTGGTSSGFNKVSAKTHEGQTETGSLDVATYVRTARQNNPLLVALTEPVRPILATATLFLDNSAVNANPVGTVMFFQKTSVSPLYATISGAWAAGATSNNRLEIRPIGILGPGPTGRCSGIGATAFNPSGATDGGVLSRTITTDANTGRATALVEQIPITLATLFAPKSILTRAAAVIDTNGVVIACGVITDSGL